METSSFTIWATTGMGIAALAFIYSWMMRSPDQQQRARKRSAVLHEIIQTEQVYLGKLDLLVDDFEQPLLQLCRENPKQSLENCVKQTFASLPALRDFHRTFLSRLQAEDQHMGQVFARFANFLKIYVAYVNTFEAKEQQLAQLQRSRWLRAFWREKSHLEPIESLLIAPIQRVPRYLLLLRELVRYTEEGSEKRILEQALFSVSESCEHVNKAKKTMDDVARLQELQAKVSNEFPGLIQPHRHLLREGVLLRPSAANFRKVSSKQVLLFLFSDLLLWTNKECKFKRAWKLSRTVCRTFDIEQDRKLLPKKSSPSAHVFAVCSEGQETELFFANDEQELERWVRDIQNAIETCKRFV